MTSHPNNFLPTSSYLEYNYSVEADFKSLAKVQVNDMHCCPSIHRPGHFFLGVNQVVQARFTFGKFLLTNNLICLHEPRNIFQENSLHKHHTNLLTPQGLCVP